MLESPSKLYRHGL